MVAVLAYSYMTISPWSVALFAIPAVAAQRLLLLYRQQRETARRWGLQTRGSRGRTSPLPRPSSRPSTRETATPQATRRLSPIYARDIAERWGSRSESRNSLICAGLCTTSARSDLPAGLLEKPGALSLDERRQMEQHSVIGERILRNVDDYGEIAAIVRHHHERVDGNGYPDHLVATRFRCSRGSSRSPTATTR